MMGVSIVHHQHSKKKLRKRKSKSKSKMDTKPEAGEWLTIRSILDLLIKAILSEWCNEEELSRRNRWLLHYTSIFILATYSTDIARACYASPANFPTKEQYINEHPEARVQYSRCDNYVVRLKDIQPFGLHFSGIQNLLGQQPSGCCKGKPKEKKD